MNPLTRDEREDRAERQYRDAEQRLLDARADGYHAGAQLQRAEMCPHGFTADERDAWIDGWLRGTWETLNRGRKAA